MTQFHKRGLFDQLRDTTFYYRLDANCRGCKLTYAKAEGYVKHGVVYATNMLYNPYDITEPMVYEEDFADITAEDYKKLCTDYIAIYKGKTGSLVNEIVSYRRYDGVYFPTAHSYRSLFKLK